MQIVRLAHFQESTASVRPLVETKNKEFQKLSSAASTVWKICISSLSLDADYDTWHTLEKEERPRGVQSLRRQRPCENAAVVKIKTRTFRMHFLWLVKFFKRITLVHILPASVGVVLGRACSDGQGNSWVWAWLLCCGLWQTLVTVTGQGDNQGSGNRDRDCG